MPRLSRFPALRHRHYRTYISGAFISQVGNQVQVWAIMWHVKEITDSVFLVGLLGAVTIVPTLALSLLGGVVADQADRRKVMLLTQSAFSGVALGIAFLTLTSSVQLWQIYMAVALHSVIRAFDIPARHALVPTLVPRRDFPNAVTLNSVSWRLSDVLAPLVVGVLLWTGGVTLGGVHFDGLSACYFLNLLSFAAILVAVWRLPARTPQFENEQAERIRRVRDILPAVSDGIKFVRRTPVVRGSMWIDFWATLFATVEGLLPFFAGAEFRVGPFGYGLLAASIALGSLFASAVMVILPTVRGQGRGVIASIAVFGLCTAGVGTSPWLPLTLLCLAGAGAADTVSTVFRQTIRQLVTPDRLRGRVTAISVLFHRAGPELGKVQAGAFAQLLSVRLAASLGGLAAALVASRWWRGGALKAYEHSDSEEITGS
ncbi:MAG: MFS transporter [Armatimonadetes bacterium]|nr:MFS transporter [Armatimonadota bacterium]